MIKSIDGTTISAFRVHECEGSSRMGSRPRRFLFTGHTNGGIQVCDEGDDYGCKFQRL